MHTDVFLSCEIAIFRQSKYLGYNCIQNFNFVRYIVGYTIRNLVLLWHASGTIKHNFPTVYPTIYISPNENFENGYPHSNALLQFPLKLELCKLNKAAQHPRKCDVIQNDILKLYLTVFCRMSQILMLSNQRLCYEIKCIRNCWFNL